ncbi:MAG: hypothetical protein ACREQH_11560 [Candidatus Binatus sp.]
MRKSILAIAMVAAAIALVAGCMQTEEIDQTLPPYASISDEAREPRPAPPANSSGDSGGVISAIGDAIAYPFHLIGEALDSSSGSGSN